MLNSHFSKSSAIFKKTSVLVGLVILLTAIACQNPSSSAETVSSMGSISGKAVYLDQSDNSGIIVSAESVNSAGQTAAVSAALAGNATSQREPLSRAIVAQATTDASGNYTLKNLAAGSYTLYASSNNSLEKAVYTGVTVTAGKSVSASDLTLTATGSISGSAKLGTATTGNLGIVVYIAGTSYAAMVADDGSYTISGVPVGTSYSLVASYPGYSASAPQTVAVSAGATTTAMAISLSTTISLDKTSATITIGGGSLALVATVGSPTANVSWSSDKPTIASVTSTGIVTPLTVGTANITATAGTSSATCTLTVDEFFVSGSLQSSSGDYPATWKNGVWTVLSTPSSQPYGRTSGQNTFGTDVYIAGYVTNMGKSIPSGFVEDTTPVYWKNGTRLSLSVPSGYTITTSNFLWLQPNFDTSGNLYIRGNMTKSNGSGTVPGYWYNGTWYQMSMTLSDGVATAGMIGGEAIATDGTIYFCGDLVDPVSGYPVPVYWTVSGGTSTLVGQISLGASATSIASHGATAICMSWIPDLTFNLQLFQSNGNVQPAFWTKDSVTLATTDGNTSYWNACSTPWGILSQVATAEPAYGLNWQIISLPGVGQSSWVNSTSYDSVNIYNAGESYANGHNSPVIWINGTAKIISTGSYDGGWISQMWPINF